MQVAVKPYLTTGAALLGAGAIAIAPIQVAPPDIKVPAIPAASTAVGLMANPVEFYAGVIERAVGNTTALAELFLEAPAPILEQVLANQIANLEESAEVVDRQVSRLIEVFTTVVPQGIETALGQLTSGNVEEAINTLLQLPLIIGLPIIEIAVQPAIWFQKSFANLNNIVQEVLPSLILAGPLALLGPVNATIGAFGSAIQDVIDATGAGDPAEVVNALVNFPGVIVDGFLNGGYGGFLSSGILSPGGMGLAGPIAVALNIRQEIARAIGWTPPTAAATTAADTSVSEAGAAGDPGSADQALGAENASLVNLKVSASDDGEKGPEAGAAVVDDADTEADDAVDDADADATDEADDSTDEADEADGTDDADGDEDGKTANGGDDLSGGNKAEPGSGSSGSSATESGAKNQLTDTMERLGAKPGAFGLGGGNDAGSDDSDSSDSDAGDGGSGGDE